MGDSRRLVSFAPTTSLSITPRLKKNSGDLILYQRHTGFSSCHHRKIRIHQVVYSGEIEEHEQHWILGHRNQFPSGFVTTVDAETASILKASRFQHEFDFNKLPPSACGVPSTEPERDDPFVLAAAGGDSANGQSCCPPSDSSARGKCC